MNDSAVGVTCYDESGIRTADPRTVARTPSGQGGFHAAGKTCLGQTIYQPEGSSSPGSHSAGCDWERQIGRM